MVSDDIVLRLRESVKNIWADYSAATGKWAMEEAADEIERLRAEKDALLTANHQAMWDDTLIPIAWALGVDIKDENGVLRRQFQMVEAIIKAVRGE